MGLPVLFLDILFVTEDLLHLKKEGDEFVFQHIPLQWYRSICDVHV